jgi:hypothetical protein
MKARESSWRKRSELVKIKIKTQKNLKGSKINKAMPK